MFDIRVNLVIRRYELIVALIILFLTGSIALSSKDSDRAIPLKKPYFKKIALTFDDGPHQIYTQKLLSQLRAKNVHATFFVVGNQVVKYPMLLKLINDNGHEIENHSFTHPNLSKLSTQQIQNELTATKEIIKSVTGQESTFFRPPGGQYNKNVLEITSKMGLNIALWNVFPKDHQETDSKIIVKRVLSQADDGGVIILHSGLEPTLNALGEIIDELKSNGYYFVTLSQLSKEPGSLVASWQKKTNEEGY